MQSSLALVLQNKNLPPWNGLQKSPFLKCETPIITDLSSALEQVVQVLKDANTVPFPASCLEIKASSSSSPSGYYTISNGKGPLTVVYCNMDELSLYTSLEQTLTALSNTLDGITNAVSDVSESVTGASDTLMGVSNAVTDITNILYEVLGSITKGGKIPPRVSSTGTNSICDILHSFCQ